MEDTDFKLGSSAAVEACEAGKEDELARGIQLNPRRERTRQPSYHKPNPVHEALAKMAEKDREIRPADQTPVRPTIRGQAKL